MICSRPYHALFMHTMLIRPTKEELASFGEPRLRHLSTRAHFPPTGSRPAWARTRASTSASKTRLIILGTEYAGEMKKGVFTVANYFAPEARRAVDALLGHGGQKDRARRRCSSA